MLPNTKRGKDFQILCGEALQRELGRRFNLEVPIAIHGGKPHSFDLATKERDVVVECKAFAFTESGNNPAAKITSLREAANYLQAVHGNINRLLIVKRSTHPKRKETLGRYFVRLNTAVLEKVTVLECRKAAAN